MTDVTILGVTFPNIDFLELETSRAYEEGLEKLKRTSMDLRNRSSVANLISESSDAAMEWADNVLGEGAGEKLFKGKKSLSIVLEVEGGLIEAYTKAISDYKDRAEEIGVGVDRVADDINQTVNRQQRREQERQKHKNGRKKNNRKNSNYQTSPAAPAPLHVVPEPYAPEPQPAPEQPE